LTKPTEDHDHDPASMNTNRDHLVSFRGVQKTYDGVHLIVKSLDLDIARGEFLTLLGPSGSGKTTCLMLLAGFEVPTQGDILLAGRRLNDVPPHKRNIGMVFQNYALFPHLTVNENLAYPLTVRKLPKSEIKAKVAQALAMVRLETFASRYPAQLSGGQQQRVALSRALVFQPQLVLMDEPLGALDKQLREHLQLEIKHLHEALGLTVVYVTHDQSEALTMSDRVAVFNHGLIQQIDSPAKLYEEPGNSFVANFIGENNTLCGAVTAREGDVCTVRLESGETVTAQAVNVGGVGQPASLSIRPERVMLNDAS
jgi:putative spermidine/putrescine transport system ATP-binding protein